MSTLMKFYNRVVIDAIQDQLVWPHELMINILADSEANLSKVFSSSFPTIFYKKLTLISDGKSTRGRNLEIVYQKGERGQKC